jgi:hypothetical protein
VVVLLVIFNNVLQCNVINCLQRILENLAIGPVDGVHVIGTKVSLNTPKQLTISLIIFFCGYSLRFENIACVVLVLW